MLKLKELKDKWLVEGALIALPVDDEYLLSFQQKHNVILPKDLMEFFKSLNGTGGDYTDELYEFYSIDKLSKIREEFKDWSGIPNYHHIHNIDVIDELYVFANFNCSLFVYAIRLNSKDSNNNEIYAFCGEEYKIIAHSFAEFIDLYLIDSKDLYDV